MSVNYHHNRFSQSIMLYPAGYKKCTMTRTSIIILVLSVCVNDLFKSFNSVAPLFPNGHLKVKTSVDTSHACLLF